MIWIIAMGFALYFFAFRAAGDAWAARRRDPGGKPARCGLAGHQVARRLLEAGGAAGVTVAKARGRESACYDPRGRRVLLGGEAYEGTTLAAIALAAVAAAEACTPTEELPRRANRRFVTGLLHPGLGVLLVLGCIAAIFRPLLWKTLVAGWIGAGILLMLGHVFTLAWEYQLVARAMRMLRHHNLLAATEVEDAETLRKGLPLRDVKGLGAAISRIAKAILPFHGW